MNFNFSYNKDIEGLVDDLNQKKYMTVQLTQQLN